LCAARTHQGPIGTVPKRGRQELRVEHRTIFRRDRNGSGHLEFEGGFYHPAGKFRSVPIGDRRGCQRISGRLPRKSMAVSSVPVVDTMSTCGLALTSAPEARARFWSMSAALSARDTPHSTKTCRWRARCGPNNVLKTGGTQWWRQSAAYWTREA